MNENNLKIYQDDTRSFTIMYYDDSKNFKQWLKDEGFIDADILGNNWWIYRYEVFELPIDYIKQLETNNYVCMTNVGHVNWVIPKEKQTTNQHFFIKNIFEHY